MSAIWTPYSPTIRFCACAVAQRRILNLPILQYRISPYVFPYSRRFLYFFSAFRLSREACLFFWVDLVYTERKFYEEMKHNWRKSLQYGLHITDVSRNIICDWHEQLKTANAALASITGRHKIIKSLHRSLPFSELCSIFEPLNVRCCSA